MPDRSQLRIFRPALLSALGAGLALLLLAACATPLETLMGQPNTHLMIAEVYAAGFAQDGSDQFVAIHNPLDAPVDLGGWSLGDTKVRAVFPPGAVIGPRETRYAARSVKGFEAIMGFGPFAVWGEGAPGKAHRLSGAASLLLRREEGTLVLRDPAGGPTDQVVWGTLPGDQQVGWKGSSAPSPAPGVVLDRGRLESGWNGRSPGPYRSDTDTAADWRQGSDWVDRRVLRPGQTFLPYPTFTVQGLTAYSSPDSSFAVLSGLIDGARKRIDINVYSFTSVLLAERLATAARRGVEVRLLMEASSVGSLSDQQRFVGQLVHKAGGQVRWIMSQPGIGVHGRYTYDHAKYGVIDGQVAFVQSENMGRHGVPSDTSTGNRGWGAAVHDQALAQYLTRVFEADWSPGHGDIFQYKQGTPFGPPSSGFSPETEIPTGLYPHPFLPLTISQPVRVTPVLAPDHALLETKGISGLIRSARRTILVEQMYIHAHWGTMDGSPESTPNLFLQDLIAAARRGVKVRVLLADTYVDPSAPKDNAWTAAYMNRIASQEKLDLQVRLMRTDLTGVTTLHNKGMVVDGEKVLVSSINWSLNSPAYNREVGLILEHSTIAEYYGDIFTYDWNNGWPADYPLITEVNAPMGYLEFSLAADRVVSLDGWSITTNGGRVELPSGTRLQNSQPLIVTLNATAYQSQFGPYSNLVEIQGLKLSPAQDRVELRNGPELVDRVAWGGGMPGWTLSGQRPLCRNPALQDTSTYLDWTLWSAPSPGAPGCGR